MSEAWPDVAEPGNRDAILTAAAALAGSDGPDGPSASTLAMVLGRRMAGGTGPRARQELQVAVVTAAGRIFDEEVVQPALAAPAGLRQLAAVCEAFFGHLERHSCPDGCFMASAALRSEEHTSELQSHVNLVCRLLLEKKKEKRALSAACVVTTLVWNVSDPSSIELRRLLRSR